MIATKNLFQYKNDFLIDNFIGTLIQSRNIKIDFGIMVSPI